MYEQSAFPPLSFKVKRVFGLIRGILRTFLEAHDVVLVQVLQSIPPWAIQTLISPAQCMVRRSSNLQTNKLQTQHRNIEISMSACFISFTIRFLSKPK
jgi:hypothetical protein